jgi:hypothetical protein
MPGRPAAGLVATDWAALLGGDGGAACGGGASAGYGAAAGGLGGPAGWSGGGA